MKESIEKSHGKNTHKIHLVKDNGTEIDVGASDLQGKSGSYVIVDDVATHVANLKHTEDGWIMTFEPLPANFVKVRISKRFAKEIVRKIKKDSAESQ